MAGRGISLDILANVRDALRGVGDVEKALSDVESTLEDMDRSGDQSTDKMSRGFRDLAKDADRAADDVRDKFRTAYRDVEKSSDDTTDRMGRGLQDVAGEAKSSGREAAASFSGEWDDVGDFIQETAANAFEGFGPLGAAAGLAAAAGIGLVTKEFEKQQELAEKLRERLMSAYQDAAEEGRTYLDTAQVIAEAQDLMFNPDRAEEYKTLLDDQKRIGADWLTIVQAHTGDLTAQEEIQGRIKSLIESEEGTYETIRDGIQKTNPEVQAMADRWGAVIDQSQEAANNARDYQEFVKSVGEEERTQISRTRDAAQARYEGLAALAERQIMTKLGVDDTALTAAENRLRALRRSAEAGITINMRNVNGRQLLP